MSSDVRTIVCSMNSIKTTLLTLQTLALATGTERRIPPLPTNHIPVAATSAQLHEKKRTGSGSGRKFGSSPVKATYAV